jgi:hypothetical protein
MKFIDALAKGECLKDPAFWKGIQNKLNVVAGFVPLIGLCIPSLREYVTVENIEILGAGVAALNVYFTNATSTKVGL